MLPLKLPIRRGSLTPYPSWCWQCDLGLWVMTTQHPLLDCEETDSLTSARDWTQQRSLTHHSQISLQSNYSKQENNPIMTCFDLMFDINNHPYWVGKISRELSGPIYCVAFRFGGRQTYKRLESFSGRLENFLKCQELNIDYSVGKSKNKT